MPRLIPLSEIEKKLPPFVKIHPETYRGARYKAKFTDTEYGEDFEQIVYSVISFQSGCKARSDKLRSLGSRRCGPGQAVPISEVLAKLPAHLEIDVSTYKSVNQKATFYDKEYNTTFEMNVANVLRTGKGYCKQRHYDSIRRCKLTTEQIQELVSKRYGGAIKYISGYRGWNKGCLWEIEGKRQSIIQAGSILSGNYFNRFNLERWKAVILSRDWFACQKCGTTENVECHHILDRAKHPDELFNTNNGLILCWNCHLDYHSKHKFKETLENFLCWLDDKEKGRLIRERLSGPPIVPPLRARNSAAPGRPSQSASPPYQPKPDS